MTTFASLFTGGGGADQGARAAGLTPLWGVEYDAAIATVAQQNDPGCAIHVASVDDLDYAALPRVDVLHASPPCPNFSIAKTNRGETDADRELARAVARAIDAQRPALFTLENVRAYGGSQSLGIIQRVLHDLDYHVTTVIVNAADYGVPQTRERLFVIAHAGGWMQSARPLPAPVPWVGWYAAIEDLIPTLPDSQFAPWQLARLPVEIRESLIEPRRPARAFVVSNSKTEYGDGLRDVDEPMIAVTGQTAGRARAFLMTKTADKYGDGLRYDDEPSRVVGANAHGERAWLRQGRVVAMTPRALARFQSFPDSYQLPDRKSLACRVIGNAVPPLLYQRIVESQYVSRLV